MKTNRRAIWFHIPFTGISVNKGQLSRPPLSLPFKDWVKHNALELQLKGAIVAYVRNPYDRVILHYEEQCRNRRAISQYPISFNDWCTKCFDRDRPDRFMQNNPKEYLPQVAWLAGSEAYVQVHKVDQDAIQTKRPDIPYIKSMVSVDRSAYYSDTTAQLVRDWYREDFEFFNFDPNPEN